MFPDIARAHLFRHQTGFVTVRRYGTQLRHISAEAECRPNGDTQAVAAFGEKIAEQIHMNVVQANPQPHVL